MTTFDRGGWEILGTTPLNQSIEVEINYNYSDEGNYSVFDENKLLSQIATRFHLNVKALSTKVEYYEECFIHSIIISSGTKPVYVLVNSSFVDPADDLRDKRRQQMYEDEQEEYMESLAYGALRSRHKAKKPLKFKKDW